MNDGGQLPVRKVESSLAPPVDEEKGLQVIERVAVGRSLEQIAEVPGLPSKETFLIWLAMSPALATAYRHAQEVSAYAMEDEALDMLRRLRSSGTTPTQGLLRATQMLVEHLRWAAEKRNPAVYAKQAAQVATVPIQINTNLDLGDNGGTGTKEFPNIYELKAAHVDVVPLAEREPGETERKPKLTPEEIARRREKWRVKEAKAREKRKMKRTLTPITQEGGDAA